MVSRSYVVRRRASGVWGVVSRIDDGPECFFNGAVFLSEEAAVDRIRERWLQEGDKIIVVRNGAESVLSDQD